MNLADEDGETPLHIAAWHGYTSIVQTLCKAGATLDLKNKVGVGRAHLFTLHA